MVDSSTLPKQKKSTMLSLNRHLSSTYYACGQESFTLYVHLQIRVWNSQMKTVIIILINLRRHATTFTQGSMWPRVFKTSSSPESAADWQARLLVLDLTWDTVETCKPWVKSLISAPYWPDKSSGSRRQATSSPSQLWNILSKLAPQLWFSVPRVPSK